MYPTPDCKAYKPYFIVLNHTDLLCLMSNISCLKTQVGSKPFKACKDNPPPHIQTKHWLICVFEYEDHLKQSRLWRHFHPRASEMEDIEQLRILWAITQHSWMEPLSAMNGPLCKPGAKSAKPENTSELSHEVRTRDTPWRQADTAEAWACTKRPSQGECMRWRNEREKPAVGGNCLF